MSTVLLLHCRIREKKDWTGGGGTELTGTQVSLVGENGSMGNERQLKVFCERVLLFQFASMQSFLLFYRILRFLLEIFTNCSWMF